MENDRHGFLHGFLEVLVAIVTLFSACAACACAPIAHDGSGDNAPEEELVDLADAGVEEKALVEFRDPTPAWHQCNAMCWTQSLLNADNLLNCDATHPAGWYDLDSCYQDCRQRRDAYWTAQSNRCMDEWLAENECRTREYSRSPIDHGSVHCELRHSNWAWIEADACIDEMAAFDRCAQYRPPPYQPSYPYGCDQRALVELDKCGQDWQVGYNSCLAFASAIPAACLYDWQWWNYCVDEYVWDIPVGGMRWGWYSPLMACSPVTYRRGLGDDLCHDTWERVDLCLSYHGWVDQ